MQKKTAPHRRRRNPWTTGLAALSLLTLPLLLAAPSEAQRGGGRGGYSGHRGSGHGGYSGHSRGHAGRSGGSGSHGYRGNHGHGGGYGYRGSHGYGGSLGYGGSYGYRGSHGYRSNYGRHYSHGRSYGRHYGYGNPGYYGSSYYRYYTPYYYHPYSYRPYITYGAYAYYGYPAYPGPERPPSVYLDYELSPGPQVDPGGDVAPRPQYESGDAGGRSDETNPTRDQPLDLRPEAARAGLRIAPGDASVYLDGSFMGLASELPATLLLEPGDHLLEVVRPGLASRQVELRLESGEEIDLDVRLEP